MALLEVDDLQKYFPVYKGILLREQGRISVINQISFHLNQGEILGIVGESGCGKSTLARLIMKIYETTGGEIRFSGENIQAIQTTSQLK